MFNDSLAALKDKDADIHRSLYRFHYEDHKF